MKHVTMVTYQYQKFAGREIRWVNFWRGSKPRTHIITQSRYCDIFAAVSKMVSRGDLIIQNVENGWIAERRK